MFSMEVALHQGNSMQVAAQSFLGMCQLKAVSNDQWQVALPYMVKHFNEDTFVSAESPKHDCFYFDDNHRLFVKGAYIKKVAEKCGVYDMWNRAVSDHISRKDLWRKELPTHFLDALKMPAIEKCFSKTTASKPLHSCADVSSYVKNGAEQEIWSRISEGVVRERLSEDNIEKQFKACKTQEEKRQFFDDASFIAQDLDVSEARESEKMMQILSSAADEKGINLLYILAQQEPSVVLPFISKLPEADATKALRFTDRDGNTILHMLAQSSDGVSKEMFIENVRIMSALWPAIIKEQNVEGNNIFHFLAEKNPTWIPEVIKSCSDKTLVAEALNQQRNDYENGRYGTPLFCLVEKRTVSDDEFKAIFKAMVDAGADITRIHRRDEKNNIFEYAAETYPRCLPYVLRIYLEKYSDARENSKWFGQAVLSLIWHHAQDSDISEQELLFLFEVLVYAGGDIVPIFDDRSIFHVLARKKPELIIPVTQICPQDKKEEVKQALNYQVDGDTPLITFVKEMAFKDLVEDKFFMKHFSSDVENKDLTGFIAFPSLVRSNSIINDEIMFISIIENMIKAGASIALKGKHGLTIFDIIALKWPYILPKFVRVLSKLDGEQVRKALQIAGVSMWKHFVSDKELTPQDCVLGLVDIIDAGGVINIDSYGEKNLFYFLMHHNPKCVPGMIYHYKDDFLNTLNKGRERWSFIHMIEFVEYAAKHLDEKDLLSVYKALYVVDENFVSVSKGRTCNHVLRVIAEHKPAALKDVIAILVEKKGRAYVLQLLHAKCDWEKETLFTYFIKHKHNDPSFLDTCNAMIGIDEAVIRQKSNDANILHMLAEHNAEAFVSFVAWLQGKVKEKVLKIKILLHEKDGNGKTPLFLLAQKDAPDKWRRKIEENKVFMDPFAKMCEIHPKVIYQTNDHNENFLHVLVEHDAYILNSVIPFLEKTYGHDVVLKMLGHKADESKDQITPFLLLASKGVILKLPEDELKRFFKRTNDKGENVFHLLAKNKPGDINSVLKSHPDVSLKPLQAKTTEKSEYPDWTPLFFMARFASTFDRYTYTDYCEFQNTCRQLEQVGIDLGESDYKGRNIFHILAEHAPDRIDSAIGLFSAAQVKELLNQKDDIDETPLMRYVITKNAFLKMEDFIKYLNIMIDAGADISQTDRCGRSMLDHIRTSMVSEIVNGLSSKAGIGNIKLFFYNYILPTKWGLKLLGVSEDSDC